MKKIIGLLLGISVIMGCNNKDTKVVYIDGKPPIDSNTVFLISVDKDGKVTDTYVNEKYFNNENIIAANNSLNDSSFYEITKDSLGKTHKIRTFKYDYIKDIYSVYIKNDTVMMGEDFKGTITLSERNILLEIDDSTSYRSQFEVSNDFKTFTFNKKTNKLGVYKFQGQLNHKDKIIPFEYNYVVVSQLVPAVRDVPN